MAERKIKKQVDLRRYLIAAAVVIGVIVAIGIGWGLSSKTSDSTAVALGGILNSGDEDPVGNLSAPLYTADQFVTIKVARTPYSNQIGSDVFADRLGFYKEQGINIQYVDITPGTEIDALKNGSIDLLVGQPDLWINAEKQGVDVQAVLNTGMGSAVYPLYEAYVLSSSTISDPKDVVGKKVALPTGTDWDTGAAGFYWSQYFLQNNIDKSKVTIVPLNISQMSTALEDGSVDIITVNQFDSDADQMADDGHFRRLWTNYDATNGTVIDKQNGGIILEGFTKDYVNKHPDIAKRFVEAHLAAQAYDRDFHDEHAKWLGSQTGFKRVSFNGGDIQTTVTGQIRDAAIQPWIDWQVKAGKLSAGQIKTTDLYTNQFNPFNIYTPKNNTYWDNLPSDFLYIPTN